jgi:hypothetical protein
MSKTMKVMTILFVLLNLFLMAMGHLIFVMVAERFAAFTVFGIISFINVVLFSLSALKKGRFALVMLAYEVVLFLLIKFEVNVLLVIIISLVFASFLAYFGYTLYKKIKQEKHPEADKE